MGKSARLDAGGVRRLALALPETSEEPHFDMTSYRVRKRIFATVTPAEDRVHIFVPVEDVDGWVAESGGVAETLLWGQKVRGVKVALPAADAAMVEELLGEAWLAKAPKRLGAEWLSRSGRAP